MLLGARSLASADSFLPSLYDSTYDVLSFFDQVKRDNFHGWAQSTVVMIEAMVDAFKERKRRAAYIKAQLEEKKVVLFDPRKASDIPDVYNLIVFTTYPDQWLNENNKTDWYKTINNQLDVVLCECDDQIKALKNHLEALCILELENTKPI